MVLSPTKQKAKKAGDKPIFKEPKTMKSSKSKSKKEKEATKTAAKSSDRKRKK